MAVTKVGTASTVLSSTGITGAQTITGTYGTGQNATAGNLLVARVTAYCSTSTTAISTPSGWTKIGEAGNGGHRAAVYWCVRGSSPQAQPQFGSTLTGSYGRLTCRITEVTGQDPAVPVGGWGVANAIGGSTAMTVATSAGVTVTGGWAFDCRSLYFGTTARTFSVTNGTGFTGDYTTGGSSYQSHGQGSDSSANTGTGTVTDASVCSRTVTSGCGMIAVIVPASSDVSANLACATATAVANPLTALTPAATRVSYAETTWPRVAANGHKQTPTVSWADGDLIVVLGGTESAANALAAPTLPGAAGSLSLAAWGSPVGSGSQCWAGSWAGTATADGSSVLDIVNPSGINPIAIGIAVWVFRNHGGQGNRAAPAASSAKTISLTRSGDHSRVCFAAFDYSAAAVTGYSFTPAGATADEASQQDAGGSYSVYVGDWDDQGAAGSLSYGTSGETSSGPFSAIALEILSGQAPSNDVSADAASAAAAATANQPAAGVAAGLDPPAAGTAAGNPPGTSVRANLGCATATAAANPPAAGIAAGTGTAAGTAAGNPPAAGIAAGAGAATAAGTANIPTSTGGANPPSCVFTSAKYGLGTAGVLTSDPFTPQTGDVIVVKGISQNNSYTLADPVGGGWAYTRQVYRATSGHCWTGLWTAPVTAGGTEQTVAQSCSDTTKNHGLVVELWRNGQLAATPATCAAEAAGSAPLATLTTVADNSVVSWCNGDWVPVSGASRAYRDSPTETGYWYNSSAMTGYWAYQAAPAAGDQTLGLTAPTGQTWTLLGIEIQSAGGGGNVSANAAAAAGTAAGNPASARVAANLPAAAAAGTAPSLAGAVRANLACATVNGTANGTASRFGGSATPGSAGGTAVANPVSSSGGTNAYAGLASGAGAANTPSPAVRGALASPSGSAVANAPSAAVGATAGSGAGAGTANPPGSRAAANLPAATAGAAGNPVLGGNIVQAPAASASAAGAGYPPGARVAAGAGPATAAGTAGPPGSGIRANLPGPATAAAAGNPPSSLVARLAPAGLASAAGTAYQAGSRAAAAVGAAAAAGTAAALAGVVHYARRLGFARLTGHAHPPTPGGTAHPPVPGGKTGNLRPGGKP